MQNLSSFLRTGLLAAALAFLATLIAPTIARAEDRALFPSGSPSLSASRPASPSRALESATSTEPASLATAGSAAKSATSDVSGTLATGASRSSFGEVLPTAAALGATILVIVLARSAVKRWGGKLAAGKRPSGLVEILARYPVARGQQIVLLKVGRRVIVAHQGTQGMQSLSEFSSAEDVADILARCEAGTRKTGEFSFDSLLRQSGKIFESAESRAAGPHAVKFGSQAVADPRDALPAVMRGAEIETVDLTRRGRGGAR